MSNLKNFLFTSESVSEGHPDKVSDRVASLVPCARATDHQAAVNEMKSFPRIEGVSAEQVREWIAEGRA